MKHFTCAVCGKLIQSKSEPVKINGKVVTREVPASLYWDEEKKEVYCCAEHVLKNHKIGVLR